MCSEFLYGQVSKIEYERKLDWTKIVQSMTFMSKEEKDRMAITWGKRSSDPVYYSLLVDSVQSIYQIDEEKLTTQDFSWRREKRIIHTNYRNKRKLDNIEILGKAFVFDEDLPRIKWKIMNEIKEVAGYVCMKAVTTDTIKNQVVVAWFTSEIPISIGPDNYYGLPGLILEISKNDGSALITATEVSLKNINKPILIPKKKGKKITTEKMNALILKHIKESMAAQRNPYWSLEY